MRSLAQHVFPTKVKFFMDSFRQATKKDQAYLLLELNHLTPDPGRVRPSIFNTEEVEIHGPPCESKDLTFDLDP